MFLAVQLRERHRQRRQKAPVCTNMLTHGAARIYFEDCFIGLPTLRFEEIVSVARVFTTGGSLPAVPDEPPDIGYGPRSSHRPATRCAACAASLHLPLHATRQELR